MIVAVHPEPPCRADQLLGRYINGQPVMAGMHLGSIELIDTSPRACSLQGRIELRGIGNNGRADTQTYTQPVGPALELSPRTTIRTLERNRSSALIAIFSFTGSSHDPDVCRSPNVIPDAWSITLSNGETIRISNHTPGNGGPFYTCQGSLSRGFSPTVALPSEPS